MNMKKIAVMSLLAGGLLFAGAQSATAEDETNVCPDGYVLQYDDNGSANGCVVDVTTFDETDTSGDVTTTDGSCWVDDSGNNICARTYTAVPGEEPTPTPIPIDGLVVCTDTTEQSTDTSGNEMTQCDNAPIMYDNVMQTGAVEDKSALTSLTMKTNDSSSSNSLMIMGILVGLAGAGAIGLQTVKAKKK